jgi:hypothetical protein
MIGEVVERIDEQKNCRMFIKFGLDTIDLKIGVDAHNLMENEEITKHRKFCTTGLINRKIKQAADHELPKETQEKMLAEAKELGKPSIKSDGTLTYDYLLQISTLVEKYIVSN